MSNHNPYLKEEYQSRINRVMDYVEKNLEQELSLDQLANVANFSPFHFHRIFRAMVGEPLKQFILRIRLEKAATQLLFHPKKTITEIALDCGFSSSATFARAFKDKFECSASDYRKKKTPIIARIAKRTARTINLMAILAKLPVIIPYTLPVNSLIKNGISW